MKLTRRKLIKKSGQIAGALALSLKGFNFFDWSADAQEADIEKAPTLCNTCGSQCGAWAYVKNGRIWKVEGHEDHAWSMGKLCARSHGGLRWVYDPDRIKQPLKRVGEGEFEPISWNQALDEISEKLEHIINEYGPQAVGYGHYPRSTGTFYGNRFMYALGVSTVCTHLTSCSAARNTGFLYSMGGVPEADLSNSKYVLMIGRNHGGGIKTGHMKKVSEAIAGDTKVVCVDPRQNDIAKLADKWVPIMPGTDLAMVLAISNEIIQNGWYDEKFVNEHAVGFEEYAENIKEYTPEWAEDISDVPADTIREMAKDLGENRPHALVHPSWGGAFGALYANSDETARAVSCLNGLIGNINQEGGLIFYNSPELGSLDESQHPAPEVPQTRRADGVGVIDEYPLAGNYGLPHYLMEKAKAGTFRSMFIRHHNPVRNFPDYEHMAEGFKSLDLSVVFEINMTETAMLADYILPECSFMEREEMINAIPGPKPSISMRTKVIPKVYEQTRSFDEIIVGLAERLGIGQYFNFTLDDLNRALLEPYNITLEEFKEIGSMTVEVEKPASLDDFEFNTRSRQFEFFSELYEHVGQPGVVGWQEPEVGVKLEEDEFKLITGKEGFHSHTATANIDILAQITKDYDTNRLWMNKATADQKGIEDGDRVKVISPLKTQEARIKVTQRVHPGTVFMPSGYGNKTPYYETSNEIDAINTNDLVPYQVAEISGHAMRQEVLVKIEKA
ncbi:MAG: molybdopterin-dependent oxidoreductase [Halarsenatibacteraceae bacterium]